MMIAPNSLDRQGEGGDQGKEDQTGTLTSGADAPTSLSWSSVLDARNMIKHGQTGMRFYYKARTKGTRE